MDGSGQRAKHAEKMRRWRAANKERAAATRAEWRAKNPTKSALYSRTQRDRDPEAARRRNREWYARNKEAQRARKLAYRNENLAEARQKSVEYNRRNLPKMAAIARNRRARAKAGGRHNEAEVAEIFEMQRGKCAYCRVDLTKRKRHVDHIEPLARGGSNSRENLQILCVPCNKTKSAKDPIAFAQSLGRLL